MLCETFLFRLEDGLNMRGQRMGCFPSVKRDNSGYTTSTETYDGSDMSSFLEGLSNFGQQRERKRRMPVIKLCHCNCGALLRRPRRTHATQSSTRTTNSSRKPSDGTGRSTPMTTKSKHTSSSAKSEGPASNNKTNESSRATSIQSNKKIQEPQSIKTCIPEGTSQDITSTSPMSMSPSDMAATAGTSQHHQQKASVRNTMVYGYYYQTDETMDSAMDSPTEASTTEFTSFTPSGLPRKIYGSSRFLELDSDAMPSDGSNQICIIDDDTDLIPVRGPEQCSTKQPYLLENSLNFSPARIMRFLKHNQDGKVIIMDNRTGTPYLLKSIDKHGALVDADTEKAQSALMMISESLPTVATDGLVLEETGPKFRRGAGSPPFKRRKGRMSEETTDTDDTKKATPPKKQYDDRSTKSGKKSETDTPTYVEDLSLQRSESLMAFTTAKGNPIKSGEDQPSRNVRDDEDLNNSPSLVFESYASVMYDESKQVIKASDMVPLGEERTSQDSLLVELRKLIIENNLTG